MFELSEEEFEGLDNKVTNICEKKYLQWELNLLIIIR